MQRARVHAKSDASGVGTTHQNIYTIDETNGVNVHGLRLQFAVEPIDSTANANLVWALWCLPDAITAVPIPSIALMELEGSNAFIWATGVCVASNEFPYTSPSIDIMTSRNCQRDARIVFAIKREGVSAGDVRILSIMRCFTKSL